MLTSRAHLGIYCVAAWIACVTSTVFAAERPNILWITAEDMSPTLGCWGDRYAHTPNIDALARESVKYSQAFATAPVCSPARSCLITGCYATSLGTQRLRSQFPIPSEIVGFPTLLRQAGYFCTNNVKTDYNMANMEEVVRRCWDICSRQAHWRKRSENQPFFAVFNDMTSHQSRTMVWPEEQFRDEVQSELSPDVIHDPDLALVPPYYPDTPLIRRSIARYYDCVSVMDQHVGQLLQQLEQDGLADDTIVFFYSDHGSGMPRHKRALLDSGMHVPLLVRFPEKYQHLAPAAAGQTVDRLVSFVDFPPTVLSLCGIDIPEYMQGFAFLGAGNGHDSDRPTAPRSYVFGARDRVDEAYDVARSVRDHRYLYIRNFMPHRSYHQPSFYADQGEIRAEISRYANQHPEQLTAAQQHYVSATRPVEELYDVQADPHNIRNLASSEQHAEVLTRMRHELHDWMLRTHDAGLLPESEAWRRIAGSTPWQVCQQSERYPLRQLIQAASLVGTGPDSMQEMIGLLDHHDAAVRYWATVGLVSLGQQAPSDGTVLTSLLADPCPAVRIEAANALAICGKTDQALPLLTAELDNQDLNVALHAARTIELLDIRDAEIVQAMRVARRRAEGPGDLRMFLRFSTEAFLNP